ncbi:MAG: hypothetical protein QW734_06405 [Candidatus Bathyarchaeia archaeon]
MSRRVEIIESELAPPFNILDLPEGDSVEFIAKSYEIRKAKRAIVVDSRKELEDIQIMRIHVDLSTPVFGAPYLDVIAGRTIALLNAIFTTHKLPLRVKLTAHGKEPSKYYVVEFSPLER